MSLNTIKEWLDFEGKHLRAPNSLELFIFFVIILFVFYFSGVIDGSSVQQQLLLLVIAAISSAVISTLVKTYFERDKLFM
jgi:hypothetical protein